MGLQALSERCSIPAWLLGTVAGPGGTWLLSPGYWQHWGDWLLPLDGMCAQPCHVGLAWELRKDIARGTPGRSYGQRGPRGGISLGQEHLVLSPA